MKHCFIIIYLKEQCQDYQKRAFGIKTNWAHFRLYEDTYCAKTAFSARGKTEERVSERIGRLRIWVE